MSKGLTLIVRTLFWMFLLLDLWVAFQWMRGLDRAWLPFIACTFVTGYCYFLNAKFGYGKVRPSVEEDD